MSLGRMTSLPVRSGWSFRSAWAPTLPCATRLGRSASISARCYKSNPSSGEWSPIADLAEYEAANDSDAGQPGVERPDSNPYGVNVRGTTVTVTDAGANAVLQFEQRLTGDPTIETLAVLPFRIVEAPPFPDLPPEIPMQPVPTSVVRHGGTYYVGQLTGFPFPVGGANVYQVRKGQEPDVYAGGFTNIRAGRYRGSRDGSYYVTNKAVFGEGQGEVLRIRP